jgi:coenzyme F420-0:L-glutamate ligase/coenzyme F420-1:gamma-L-glutamate ligase
MVEAIETKVGRAPTVEELAFLRERRVGRLATADAAGSPAVVPICFAVVDDERGPAIVSALDEKPKRVPVARLRRVRHILENPEVALVADDYVEDWRHLAFVQVRGRARLVEPGEPGFATAIATLRGKYPQYQRMAIAERPMIRIEALTAASWQGSGSAATDLPRPTDLAGIVQGRRSVRAFAMRPVDPELIRQAIAMAGWAPSPHGRQPWRFGVVERQDRKVALADAMAGTWQSQLELDGQEAAIVQIRLAKSRERMLTAPFLIVPCLYLADLDVYPDADRQAAETTMAIQSIGAAIQNLLLALYAAGLDGGWMCAPLFCQDVVRDTLGLDARLIPHALIPVGYAAKDPVRRDRLPLDRLIASWE